MTGKETKNIMVRAGSAPKTICFSHTQTKRQFEFQDLNFSKISNEVSAKMAKKVSTKPINLLTESNLEHEKVKVYKLPDTSRCFIPELNNEPDKISKRLLEARLHRTHYESPGNFNTLLCKTGNEFSITNCRKQSNSKIYRSYVLGTEVSENDCSRRFYKKCEFGKYNSTTQILTIPGGVKRTSPILEKTKISSSFNIKIMNDYKSKISCLPGTVKKVEKSEPLSKRLFTTKSRNDQIETTIFYTQTDNSQVKTTETFKNLKTEPSNMTHFNVSNNNRSKKDRDIFGQSNKEKKFISQTKLKRPLYIKNPFESQITII